MRFPRQAGRPAIRERIQDMRDELDGRMWVDHHDGFGDLVDNAAAALRAGIARFAGWDGSTHQLLAMAGARAGTGLSLTIANNAACAARETGDDHRQVHPGAAARSGDDPARALQAERNPVR